MFSRAIRSRSLAQSCRSFATSTALSADFTHAVIGGGAVGLSIARQLAGRDGTSTLLIERNAAVGMETSSRNSEVIHAGLYYGATSLKTALCIEGRHLLYALCIKHQIAHANTGKWIVAQTNAQWEELVKVHKFAREIGVPTSFVSLERAAREEPFVKADVGILESPTTGILDSHAFMQFLLGDLEDRGGDVATHSPVVGIRALGEKGSQGWEVTTKDRRTGEESSITAEVLINSAGLGAVEINNMVLPASRHRKMFYAKGNYFSYAPSTPLTTHLIYPAPESGLGGLGTHLTLDISGRIRFGPDVEWVDSPDDLSVSRERLEEAIEQIKRFLPEVQADKIVPDYAGIRPKLGRASAVVGGGGFLDFVVQREEGVEGFVNLLGIESPGLTSSLAIGRMVEELLYK
ncbi:mitochondrial putative L-2-hydroxyglutarate dehydrogenase [Calycina marina]|uniref:L-2-hydroxyglutarate dehydrogenase, mitochondrial n=1 Tax=Calycina marina TaxID=1763456 RepID=A0A9P7ZCQ4_9HELO|nr:mitochondrial putative L-2-hydroxyglutarate dehydrogenase [Calycina marina]